MIAIKIGHFLSYSKEPEGLCSTGFVFVAYSVPCLRSSLWSHFLGPILYTLYLLCSSPFESRSRDQGNLWIAKINGARMQDCNLTFEQYWKLSKQECQKGMIKQSWFFADQNSWSQSQTLQQVTVSDYSLVMGWQGISHVACICNQDQNGIKQSMSFLSSNQEIKVIADIKGSMIQRRHSCQCVL